MSPLLLESLILTLLSVETLLEMFVGEFGGDIIGTKLGSMLGSGYTTSG